MCSHRVPTGVGTPGRAGPGTAGWAAGLLEGHTQGQQPCSVPPKEDQEEEEGRMGCPTLLILGSLLVVLVLATTPGEWPQWGTLVEPLSGSVDWWE